MKDHFAQDRVLKDLFQMDHPSLLDQLTGGVRVRQFLNVEFQRIIERRADMVAVLDDGSVFHLEIQGKNDKRIPYREGIYGLLVSERFQRPVKQVVLYVGEAKMRMDSELDTGGVKVSFRLVDIREIDASALMKSGCAGDLALAMLAKGGTEMLPEIARRTAGLSNPERVRVIMQLVLLSSLRKLSGRLKMELTTMGPIPIEIRDNEILREVWEEVMAEGLAEGEMAGMKKTLRGQLSTKFERVPKWVEERLAKANKAQIQRWLNKVVVAQTLEGVIGKK